MRLPAVSSARNFGFTLVELMLAVSFALLVAGAASPIWRSSLMSGELDTVTMRLIGDIRIARTNSSSRLSNATYGVRFEMDRYILYRVPEGGSPLGWGGADHSADINVSLPSGAYFTTTLPGDDLVFLRGVGLPSISTDAIVTLTRSGDGSRTVAINTFGFVEQK